MAENTSSNWNTKLISPWCSKERSSSSCCTKLCSIGSVGVTANTDTTGTDLPKFYNKLDQTSAFMRTEESVVQLLQDIKPPCLYKSFLLVGMGQSFRSGSTMIASTLHIWHQQCFSRLFYLCSHYFQRAILLKVYRYASMSSLLFNFMRRH